MLTPIEDLFTLASDITTFVSITNAGLGDDSDGVVKQAPDSTEGFVMVWAAI